MTKPSSQSICSVDVYINNISDFSANSREFNIDLYLQIIYLSGQDDDYVPRIEIEEAKNVERSAEHTWNDGETKGYWERIKATIAWTELDLKTFPFDVQILRLTFSSVSGNIKDLKLLDFHANKPKVTNITDSKRVSKNVKNLKNFSEWSIEGLYSTAGSI